MRRISDTSRYLDSRSSKRAKAIYMFTRSMNQSHYDYTRNTHRWWSMQGFKWPFARFMDEYPHIRESSINKRIGLVSRYNKFYFSREPFLLSARRLLAHDTSNLASVTRTLLFQFMDPTWFSYFNGDDIIKAYPYRVSIREEYNKMKYSTKLRWFVTRLALRQLFRQPDAIDKPFLIFLQDEVDKLIKDLYLSIYYLPIKNEDYTNLRSDFLMQFGLNLYKFKKLDMIWKESLKRYTNKFEEDADNTDIFSVEKNLFRKGLNNYLLRDFDRIALNRLINYYFESESKRNDWASFLLDSQSNSSCIYDFESLKFLEDCESDFRSNKNLTSLDSDKFWFDWFNSLNSSSSFNENIDLKSNTNEVLAGLSKIDLYEFEKLQRESPNSLAFLGLGLRSYSNRLSSHIDSFMSNFVFDSYKSKTVFDLFE